MSGIHGLLRFDGTEVRDRDLEAQARALAHRGRDRHEIWRERAIGLGHLLNRVTVEDRFDAQPAVESAIALVADLRLDNREALAAALGIDPAGRSDSALLLEAYKRWGADCVEHLLGDFAFAIWDGGARKLVLGRDHLGQRNIYYHRGERFFAFASEPRGLWAVPDVPRALAGMTVARRLARDRAPHAGTTHFEGIFGIEGGTVMTVASDGTPTTRRYWEPHADPEHLDRDEAYYVEAYRRVLSEAVTCRLRRTIRPAGLFLGAGFDSGAIAGLAGPVVDAQGRKLIAVTSAMPQGDAKTPRNARRWATLLARHMPHLDLRFVTREGLDIFSGIEASYQQVEGLRGADRYANDAIMGEIASAGARVVMDGNGGDSTLNPRARRAPLRLLLRGRLSEFLREFRAYRASTGVRYPRLILRELIVPLLPTGLVAPFDRVRRGFAPFAPPSPVSRELLAALAAAGSGPPAYFPDVLLKDRRAALAASLRRFQSAAVMGGSLHAAAHGMEMTLPYYDKRVVELALAIPEELIFRNGRDRYLARQALADVLPPEYRTRDSTNDDVTPDFCAMIARVEPRMLEEIDRMEKDGRLTRLFDFARMRRLLTGRDAPFRRRRTSPAVHNAARAFLHARIIERFQRDNYRDGDGDGA